MNRLFTRYLNSAAFYDVPDDKGQQQPEKTPAEIQREKIAGTMSVVSTEDDDKQQEEENSNNDNEENEEENDDEGEDDKKEDDAPADETEDQKKERLAAEREQRKQARQQRKWDKLAAEKTAAEKEVERLKKQLEAKPDANLTEEEVQRRAEELAAEKIKERTASEIQKQFQKDCDSVQEAAVKADKDFMRNINTAAEEVGAIPAIMIGVLRDLDNDNGGEVLAYLAKNIDDYEEVHGLSEGKMTAKLIRISDKLKAEAEAAKAAKKQARSKAPAPIEPVNAGRDVQSSNVLPANPTKSKEDMDKFVRIRNEQLAARRKANGGLL